MHSLPPQEPLQSQPTPRLAIPLRLPFMGRAWFKRLLSLAGGTDAVTEGAASPMPSQSQSHSQGVDWSGILGALRQGSTPDGAASLDGGQLQTHSSAFVLHQQLT